MIAAFAFIGFGAVGCVVAFYMGLLHGTDTVAGTRERWRLSVNASVFALEAAASSLRTRSPDIAKRCLYEAARLKQIREELP